MSLILITCLNQKNKKEIHLYMQSRKKFVIIDSIEMHIGSTLSTVSHYVVIYSDTKSNIVKSKYENVALCLMAHRSMFYVDHECAHCVSLSLCRVTNLCNMWRRCQFEVECGSISNLWD